MEIESPFGSADCKCGTSGEICVRGSGAIRNGVVASKVYVAIYQPPNSPPDPNSPPYDAVYVTPDENGNWCFGLVSGAACGTVSPYPQNTVWVWAEFDSSVFSQAERMINDETSSDSSSEGSSSSSSGTEDQYIVTSQGFTGRCTDNIGQCCDDEIKYSSEAHKNNIADTTE